MSIRRKILLYFSITVICLTGATFMFIFILFSEYREEEFQQRQKEKIITTLMLLTEIRQIDERLLQEMDLITIHELFDEKLLIFDQNKQLIYSSIDDLQIDIYHHVLDKLSPTDNWHETKDGLYDVVGLSMMKNGATYYGISKAFDSFGYSKLNFLRAVLAVSFLVISLTMIVISSFLSKRISRSIIDLTDKIRNYDFEQNNTPLAVANSRDEIAVLAQRFNELMKRMNDAFSFQKHAIHHISHELKTPVAVLVSNFERIEKEQDIQKVKALIKDQKEDTKSLSEIVNAMLEIAKTESGNHSTRTAIRVDELIFDLVNEFSILHPDFRFLVEYAQSHPDEGKLTVEANHQLLKSAFRNLMHNGIQYSDNQSAAITISATPRRLQLNFENSGAVITESEKQYLFKYFFRGENSKHKRGFGIGLVFVKKILNLHHGDISYSNHIPNTNIFVVELGLS